MYIENITYNIISIVYRSWAEQSRVEHSIVEVIHDLPKYEIVYTLYENENEFDDDDVDDEAVVELITEYIHESSLIWIGNRTNDFKYIRFVSSTTSLFLYLTTWPDVLL